MCMYVCKEGGPVAVPTPPAQKPLRRRRRGSYGGQTTEEKKERGTKMTGGRDLKLKKTKVGFFRGVFFAVVKHLEHLQRALSW